MKIFDSNNTLLQENIMSYLGNGLYKQTYDGKTIQITIEGTE